MAGFIPDDIVREVVQRVDLMQLIGESVSLRKVGARFVGLCPFHAEKTPSFSVNPEQGFYYCFGCQASGDAIHYLRETQGLEFREAVEQLAARTGVRLPEEEEDEQAHRAKQRARSFRSRVLEANSLAQAFFRSTYRQAAGEAARAYVEKREIEPEIVDRFGIGAAPESWDALTLHLRRANVPPDVVERSGLVAPRNSGGYYDRFRGRLTFPVHDVAGKVLGFSARIVVDAEGAPKYVNSPESPTFKKGEELFGIYQARRAMRAARRAVLVEGNVDVVMLSQAGVENVVAPLGTALTEQQVLKLKRFVDDVDVVFDGDRAGREAAAKALALLLRNGLGGRICLLPEGDDPDTLVRREGAQAFADRLAAAPTLPDSFVESAMAHFDGSVPSKARAIDAVRPLFEWLEDRVVLDEYERLVEQRLALPVGTLSRYVSSPEPIERLGPPTEVLRGRAGRVTSRVEIDILRLLLAYPHFVSRFLEAGGVELIQGDARRGLAEKIVARYDDWSATLDGLALIEEIREPKIRDFVARALTDEPVFPEAESERAFEECIERLKLRNLRERGRSLSATLAQARPGELNEEILATLRARTRLRDGEVEGDEA